MLAFLVALAVVPYFYGVRHGEQRAREQFKPTRDTVIIMKDTTIYEPKEVIRWKTRHDTVALPVVKDSIVHDSVLVEIPIEQIIYKDTLCTAWISGFRAKMDSIRITRPTIVITETIHVKDKVRHLGWGIAAGPTILYNGKVHAGVGVTAGLTYKF